MYKIGELSRLCRIPVKTLRYYDNEGLLVADEIDRFTGYRYYSAARIADCNRIISLKELGFSLEEIKKHLQAGTDEDILALVDAKWAEIEEKTKEMEYRENNLDLAVCVEITGKLPNTLGYEEKTLTFSGELATLVCKREQLDDGYRSMLSQIHEIDHQIIGASYEIYYEDGTVELKIPVCKKANCMDPVIEKQEFENDDAAVGKWEIRDIVLSKEQFVYGYPKCPEAENSVWKEICFPEGGEPYWFLKGWTKGFLYLEATNPEPHLVAMPYSIETMNGRSIMFLEIPRRYEDGSRDAVPQLLVFEKVKEVTLSAKEKK